MFRSTVPLVTRDTGLYLTRWFGERLTTVSTIVRECTPFGELHCYNNIEKDSKMAATRSCFLFIAVHLVCAIAAQEMDKRVPQGFLGMRGKKYLDSEEPEQFYKRKPQFFVGVKGKKSYDEEYIDYKRTPTGFVGMRGKKEYPELILLPNPDAADRAGSLFGQIDYTANELGPIEPSLEGLISDYIQRLQGSNLSPEHAEAADEYDGVTNEAKRGLHQFYGVRGKKSAQSKRPYDLSFRGKFIGVRGKKDGRGGAQEIKFLLGQGGPWPKRKAQLGFVGMRGKKWTDESSPEETPN
ncbi:unnamed protein product, partial [Iphiclides podalirius]